MIKREPKGTDKQLKVNIDGGVYKRIKADAVLQDKALDRNIEDIFISYLENK